MAIGWAACPSSRVTDRSTPTRPTDDRLRIALRAWLRRKRPRLNELGLPVALCAGIPLSVYLLAMMHYGVGVSKATLLLDFCFLAYLSGLFCQFQKNARLAVVPFVIAMTTLLVAAVQKYVMLRVWVRFGDLFLLDEAWRVLPLGQRLIVLSVVALALGLTIYNRRRPQYHPVLLLLAPLVIAGTLLVTAPGHIVRSLRATTNAVFGNDPLYRSPFFALAYDLAERLAFEQETATLLALHGSKAASVLPQGSIQNKRNVHFFVLESFMDPMLLGVAIPKDPLDPRFRNKLCGSSLSPVFGGRTAQAEFELLCGTPAYDFLDPVTFNDLRGAPITCLPKLLRDNGYETVVSTDISGNFFNSREGYRSLGFSQAFFRETFPTTDMDGMWVSADTLIASNKKLIAPFLVNKRPIFNYVLFVTGHVPYDMNPERRPPVLATGSTDEVTRLVNAVYYNTRSVADYIDYLAQKDPMALVFVVGDHQGALTSLNRRSDWSRQFDLERYWTPYLFLDAGQPQRHGDMAHFEAAHMILRRLRGEPYTPTVERYGADWIRPFGRRALYKRNGVVRIFPDEDAESGVDVGEFIDVTIARWLRLIQESRTKLR
jgi:phosphoglycerol transferase MdoB-like AlkP superfamily enzyme